VLMYGSLANAVGADGTLKDIGKWYGPWFYKHVEAMLHDKSDGSVVEYIPLRSYYHRHTRSLFWEMEDILPFGWQSWFRYTLGWLLPPKVGFLKLTTNAELHEIYVQKHVDQDLLVPMRALHRFLDRLHEQFRMYPLWLCPCRILKTPVRGLVNPDFHPEDDMYVDVGVYGIVPAARAPDSTYDPEGEVRDLEAFVRELKGYQALYAITYQTRPEFQEMFDHTVYTTLRERYGCDGVLPQIFDKVSVVARGERSRLDHASVDKISSAPAKRKATNGSKHAVTSATAEDGSARRNRRGSSRKQ